MSDYLGYAYGLVVLSGGAIGYLKGNKNKNRIETIKD